MKKKVHKTYRQMMSGSMKMAAFIFAMTTLFSMQVSAADYPIKIAGVTVTDYYGIDMGNMASLTIQDADIKVSPGDRGIGGYGGDLIIENSEVKIASGGVHGFANISLVGSYIHSPAGAVVEGGAIKLDGNIYTGEIVIKKSTVYLQVGGVDVTDDNKDAVPIISGTAIYNSDTRTLMLETDGAAYVYSSSADGVFIDTPAENGVEYTIWGDPGQVDYFLIQTDAGPNHGIRSKANLKLGGALEIDGNYNGIDMGNMASLTIQDADIKVSPGDRGIGGYGGDLIIENSEVKITSGGIIGFANISLVGSYIHSPAGAVVEGGAIKLDGNIYTGEIVIKKSTVYLQVGGVDVTDDNKDAVPIISGTAIYNSDTRTLMLETDGAAYVYGFNADGVSIVTPAENGVEYTIWGYPEQEDYFRIETDEGTYDGIWSKANLKLGGALDIDGAYWGIRMSASANLTIQDADILVNGGERGIGGNGGDLIIENSEVKIAWAGVHGFANISLVGSYIHSPAGAVVEGGAIKLDGNIYTGEIVIKKSPEGVDLKEAALNNAWASSGTLYIEYNQGTKATAEVFSLLGAKVANIPLNTGINSQAMDRGIYIVRIGNENHKVSVN